MFNVKLLYVFSTKISTKALHSSEPITIKKLFNLKHMLVLIKLKEIRMLNKNNYNNLTNSEVFLPSAADKNEQSINYC